MRSYWAKMPLKKARRILTFSVSVQELEEFDKLYPYNALIGEFSSYLMTVLRTRCPDFPEDARILCWAEVLEQAVWVIKVESAMFQAVGYYNMVPNFPIGSNTMEAVRKFIAASPLPPCP